MTQILDNKTTTRLQPFQFVAASHAPNPITVFVTQLKILLQLTCSSTKSCRMIPVFEFDIES